jgi:hypothetical protein
MRPHRPFYWVRRKKGPKGFTLGGVTRERLGVQVPKS